MAEILVRLAISAGLIALGILLYWGWNRWQLRRLGRRGRSRLLGLESLRPEVPGILYFTTPECVVCHTAQRPALKRLAAELGDAVQVIEVDATVKTALADHWGVLSVPTTFVIDSHGRPRAVNHGLASQDRLRRQLDASRSATAPDALALQLKSK